MNFQPGQLYHLYNRGNNKQLIFYKEENYLFFLKKIRKEILPHFDILSYCLMPNHFHLLVHSIQNIENEKAIRGIATLLSSYTKAINIQENRTGSLFQQKTKAKLLMDCSFDNFNTIKNEDYPFQCFNYIHQNPVRAKLVKRMEDWQYSSFPDYIGIRKGTLCNQSLCKRIIQIEDEHLYEQSYKVIPDEFLKNIF